MGYEIAYLVEDLMRWADRHRWIAAGALALFLLVMVYNVIKREEPLNP